MVTWPRNCIGCGTTKVRKEVKLSFDESEEAKGKESYGPIRVKETMSYSFKEHGVLYLCSNCWNFAEAEQSALKSSAKKTLLNSLFLAIVLTSITVQVYEVVDLLLVLMVLLQLAWVPIWSTANVLKFRNKYPFDSFYSIDPKTTVAPISFRNKEFSEMFSVATPYGSRYDPSIRLAKRTSRESLLHSSIRLLGMFLSWGCIIILAYYSVLLNEPLLLLPGLISGVLFLFTVLLNTVFVAIARKNLPIYPGERK
ncbi:MAG: hypothetical protein EAX95_08525 [Candidatus Thorarchaeota archaeon]|nr:hypothetical protein [Candidatus Thorarchaeota archaeon]